ncbi:MAG: alpha,alpha-trehalase, partial [Actinomycetota bacterium]|nr:alpha,alpha-trehalase [Actinomycetota bacterium]
MPQDGEPLIRLAKTILDFNWTGGYTRPGPRLYPHQWSWDSALIAIGYARYDQDRATRELNHLFESQWTNGLLPHEVHDPRLSGEGSGGLGFWSADGSPYAPGERQTSGEVQPPIHATAALYIYRHADDTEAAKAFLEEAFPRLKAWHEYLHRERDPEDEGLVYVRHPWETGMDNSPVWDSILQRIQLEPGRVPDYQRADTSIVSPQDRPLDAEYDRYAYLVRRFAERDYDEAKIREDCPFLVQDALFNALLCQSSRDLAQIAHVLGEDPSPFEDRAERTARAMNEKLWDEERATYLGFDLVEDRPLRVYVTAGFLPLFAGVPDEGQARRMVETLESPCYGLGDESAKAVASYDRYGYGFSRDRY